VLGVGADAFDLTVANWDRGVARKWAGFFVRSGTPGYAPGRRVKLGNGEVRAIVKVEEKKPYLNVFVEGKALDPNVHGTPDAFVAQ
jgi:hypothetical protein